MGNRTHTSYNQLFGFLYTLKVHLPKPWEGLPEPQTLGDHLRIARLKQGLQVKELAKKLGFSECIVSLWERGKAHPTQFWMVRKLKEILPELASLPTKLFYPYFPDSPRSLAEAVKKERLLLDLNQGEYAKRLGAGIHTIVDRERGRIQAERRLNMR